MNYKLKLTQFSSSQSNWWGDANWWQTHRLSVHMIIGAVGKTRNSIDAHASRRHKPLSSESDEIEIINWNIGNPDQLSSTRLHWDDWWETASQLCMLIRTAANINGYTTNGYSLQVLTNNSINVLIYGVSKSKWATVLPNWLLYEFNFFFSHTKRNNSIWEFSFPPFHHEVYIWA